MTSSIYLKTQHTPKIDDTLIEEIEAILHKHDLEHLNITDRLGDQMLSYIAGTLQHWEKITPTAIWIEFKETKIIEIFSFYSGFFSAGGILPFQFNQKTPKIEYRDFKQIHKSYSIVIPIGFLPDTILSILLKSIETYSMNPRIKKIFCVYDKKINDINRLAFDPKIETIKVDRPGPAHARNIGIIQSLESEITDVILADSDLLVYPKGITQLIYCYENASAAVACPLFESHGKTWFDKYHNMNGTLNGRYLNETNKQLLFGTTSLMCINRTYLENGNLFSTEFQEAAGEDIDFCLKAQINGFQIVPLDQVKIRHWYGYTDDEFNMKAFVSRFERYGRGEHRLLQKHPYYHNMLLNTAHRPSIILKP